MYLDLNMLIIMIFKYKISINVFFSFRIKKEVNGNYSIRVTDF